MSQSEILKETLLSALKTYSPNTIICRDTSSFVDVVYPNSSFVMRIDLGLRSISYFGNNNIDIYPHQFEYFIGWWDKSAQFFDLRWHGLLERLPFYRFDEHNYKNSLKLISMIKDRSEELPIEIITSASRSINYKFAGNTFNIGIDGIKTKVFFNGYRIPLTARDITIEQLFDLLFPISVVREWKLNQFV